jgi:hypothetical protein
VSQSKIRQQDGEATSFVKTAPEKPGSPYIHQFDRRTSSILSAPRASKKQTLNSIRKRK